MQKNNKTDIVWTLFKTQHYHYGRTGKLMSIVSVNEKTQMKTQSIFTRDKNGRKLAESIFAIDDAERQLEKIEKKIYKYNDDKAQATETVYRWDRKANDFMPYVKTILECEGKLHSTKTEQTWDYENNEWKTYLVKSFNKKYHENGRLSAINIADYEKGKVKQHIKIIKSYNKQQKLEAEQKFFVPYYDYSPEDNKYSYESNFDSILDESYKYRRSCNDWSYWGSLEDEPFLFCEKSFDYNENNQLISHTEKHYNIVLGDRRYFGRLSLFDPFHTVCHDIKVEYEYNTRGLLAKRKIFGADV